MLDSLLRHGYFPSELPPLFTTSIFADAVRAHAKLPGRFVPVIGKEKVQWTRPTHHSMVRVGGLRRRLSVPNPLNFHRLSIAFSEHEPLLRAKWALSPFSKTSPPIARSPRALAAPNIDRATAKSGTRIGARYVVQTDISQFYPSIYTHSIPWALHGKATSKGAIGDMTLGGNLIDRELQACQLGQTKGIPIGPDTSLGIAELLLADVDRSLAILAAPTGGVRFIDDMEFSFATLASAERALNVLESSLHDLELQLNGAKTRIREVPEPLDSTFVARLRPLMPPSDSGAASRWLDYFNTAFALAKNDPTAGLIRYATAAVRTCKVSPKVWALAQNLLWQCVSIDPGCLRFVIDAIWMNTRGFATNPLDVELATAAINRLIQASAPVNHGSEVLWALWGAALYGLPIEDESWKVIMAMEDSFVAVAAHETGRRAKNIPDFSGSSWVKWFEPGAFEDTQWLFTYEAFRWGWLPKAVPSAGFDKHPICSFLKGDGVTFIDQIAVEKYRPAQALQLLASGTGGY